MKNNFSRPQNSTFGKFIFILILIACCSSLHKIVLRRASKVVLIALICSKFFNNMFGLKTILDWISFMQTLWHEFWEAKRNILFILNLKLRSHLSTKLITPTWENCCSEGNIQGTKSSKMLSFANTYQFWALKSIFLQTREFFFYANLTVSELAPRNCNDTKNIACILNSI